MFFHRYVSASGVTVLARSLSDTVTINMHFNQPRALNFTHP